MIGRFTLSQLVVLTLFAAIVVKLFSSAIDHGLLDGEPMGIILLITGIAVGVIYCIFFMKELVLYNSIALILYALKYVQGNTKANKYKCDEIEIKSKFPIEKVYDTGIIQFKGKQFGILLKLHFPDISDSGYVAYLTRVIDLVNSLPEGIIYKSLKFSRIDYHKTGLDQLQAAINDPNSTDEMIVALNASYEELLATPPKVSWEGHGFIGIGKYRNAETALKNSKIVAEVIIKSIRNSGTVVDRMTDQYEILKVYRQMLSMREVK